MIPRHRPPFGVGRVLLDILGSVRPVSVEAVERRFADAFGIGHAVLVPSIRAGLRWLLQATVAKGAEVACPAFTCQVVHEAIVRAGARLRFVDNGESDLLMDREQLRSCSAQRIPLVLCEVFGHTYQLDELPVAGPGGPPIRIIDMAMTVPSRRLLARLGPGDVGMLSFGIGKCVYAGWGGMCFMTEPELARQLKEMRQAVLRAGDLKLALQRAIQILARTLAHNGWLYGPLRRVQEARNRRAHRSSPICAADPISSWQGDECMSPEWLLPSSPLDRRLICRNVSDAEENESRRLTFAALYRKNLQGVSGVVLPPDAALPLSHFSVRVRPEIRSSLVRGLWRRGIDAAMLFPFPSYASPHEFPRAAQTASEIMNLPLSPNLTPSAIEWIARQVTEELQVVGMQARS